MVRTLKQYWGKGPVEVRSYFFDDMLLVSMKGGMTTAEETMLDFGESDAVRGFRQVFQNRMADKLVGLVEEVTGQKVLTYQSQVLFDPDRVCEIFVFDGPGPEQGRRETAQNQLRGGQTPPAPSPDVEPPSLSGQEKDPDPPAADAGTGTGTGEANI